MELALIAFLVLGYMAYLENQPSPKKSEPEASQEPEVPVAESLPPISIEEVLAQVAPPPHLQDVFRRVITRVVESEPLLHQHIPPHLTPQSLEYLQEQRRFLEQQGLDYNKQWRQSYANYLVILFRCFLPTHTKPPQPSFIHARLRDFIPQKQLEDAHLRIAQSPDHGSKIFLFTDWIYAFCETLRDETPTFKGTPFDDLLNHPVPVPFQAKQRFSHTHCLGSTGSGKSTLLQNLIAHDLRSDASVVVIDPHHQLIEALSHLQLPRNVVIADPSRTPAINIFDVKDNTEATLATVVKMLSYIFREGDTPPTGKQLMVFQYLCRLVLVLKDTRGRNGTLLDLFNFLSDPKPYLNDIAQLPPLAQSFFRDFNSKGAEYKNTSAELRYRLHTILSNPTLERMFTAPVTQFDMTKEMDAGSLILVDADQARLGDASPIFGKIFLALIMQSARVRTSRRPVYVYVDEAHRFLDEQANDLLTDARKFGVGCIFAHQNLAQIPSAEIAGALQGTAIKFVGGVRAQDARALAPDLRTTAEALMNLPPFYFALYIQGTTPTALPVSFNADPLALFPRVSDRAYQQRFPQPAEIPKVLQHTLSPTPDEDRSDRW